MDYIERRVALALGNPLWRCRVQLDGREFPCTRITLDADFRRVGSWAALEPTLALEFPADDDADNEDMPLIVRGIWRPDRDEALSGAWLVARRDAERLDAWATLHAARMGVA